MVDSAGRRRVGSGTYNPLSDNDVRGNPPDVWISVASGAIKYCSGPSLDSKTTRECHPGAQVKAEKEGNWLKDKELGLYLPYTDEDGARLFKNERVLLMEKAGQAGDFVRTTSSGSGGGLARQSSRGSGTQGSSSPGEHGAISRRQSFRWVDAEGMSRRLSGDSEALDGLNLRPEVWVCVAEKDLAYRTCQMLDAVSSKVCTSGSKVNAVKEDEWLRVMEVKEAFDAVGAAEMIGRRSLRVPSKVNLVDTGLFLPFFEDGQRLFKNEKLALLEMSQHQQPPAPEDKGSCNLM